MTTRSSSAFGRLAIVYHTLLLFGILLCVESASAVSIKVTERKLGIKEPGDPIAYDINGDGAFEILLSGATGEMGVYDSRTLKPLWERQVGVKALTQCVVGDFLGSGAPILAAGSRDGGVYFVRPGTGELVASLALPSPITLPPSVVAMSSRDASSRDGLVICDDAGSVRLVSMHGKEPREDFEVTNVWQGSTMGRITAPAAVGDINGDEIPEIVTGTVSNAVQAFPLNDPTKRFVWHGPQGTSVNTGVLLCDLFNTGRNHLAFGTAAGDLIVLKYEHDESKPNIFFRQVLTRKMLGSAHGHLIAGDFDADGVLDIAGASEGTVVTLDGAAEMMTFGQQPYRVNVPPISPISAAELSDGKMALLFGDNRKGLFILDPTLKTQPEILDLPSVVQYFMPTGDLSGSGKVEVVVLSGERTSLALARFDAAAKKDGLPSLVPGINFQRDCVFTSATAVRLAAARDKANRALATLVQNGTAAMDKGDYEGALRFVSDALGISPADRSILKLQSRIDWRLHWLRKILVVLLVVGIMGGAGVTAYLWRARAQRFRRADGLLANGRFPEAAEAYKVVLAREPENRRAIVGLARVYLKTCDTAPGTAEILQKARQLQPENSDLTLALAKAWAQAGEQTDAALDVYLVALATMDSGRGKIAFEAANVLRKRGDVEQALKYYKLALKEGFADIVVHERLSELFMETQQYSENTLPVFEVVALRRKGDARLLEALCRSYAAARRVDDKARQAYLQLLALEPQSLIALRQCAKCELQAGNPMKATEYAEASLKVAPEDAECINLVSHCYMAMDRDDEQAIEAHLRALKLMPGQPDLLRVTALALLRKGVPADPETYQLIKRANVTNPQDLDLLIGLGETAARQGDAATVIECYEQALELGHASPKAYTRLAEAYAEAGDVSPKTERVYREALRITPDSKQIERHLAMVIAQSGRADADAIIILEKVFQFDPDDRILATPLARAYLTTSRYDDAIKLLRWLLQYERDNDELQRLFAQASLQSNRIDEAIRQYEHLIKLRPDDREATVNLASACAQKQLVDETAAGYYAKALELEPAISLVRIAFARHHGAAGRFARALEEMRQALAHDRSAGASVGEEVRGMIASAPERGDLRWFLADLLINEGNLPGAMEQLQLIFENDPSQLKPVLQAYDRVLAKDPGNVNANLEKGVLLKAQGRFEDARTFLERAYKVNSQNPDVARELEELYEQVLRENDDVAVRFELGKLNYAQNDYDKAVGQFQKTAQDFRYENESIKMLGLCFIGKGMLEFALQEFLKLVIDEEMKEILYDLAQRYEAKNDLVGAKQVYRQLYKVDINYRNVKTKFDMLAGSTSDPMTLERTAVMTQLSEKARLRYELVEELGRGAMGIVYQARDNELEEVVALKILPENLSQNPDALNRFRAEARSARRLAHPNIVRIHDIGEELGRKYISMEYVKGSDLKRHLKKKGKFTPQELVPIARQVCSALDYAHSMGIVHRDIKPANIMISDNGTVKVSDFGIAKILESTGDTIAGSIIGTPLYMSPEQIQGQPIDNRADIYSLGIMLYELLTGKPPFIEGDLAYQHLRVPPAPLQGVPESLAAMVMKCLEKDRANRWKTAGEMLPELDAAIASV